MKINLSNNEDLQVSGNLNNVPKTVNILALADSKLDTLVSGTNVKTINNTSILGSGNIDTKEFYLIPSGDVTILLTAAFTNNISNLTTFNTACENILTALKLGKIIAFRYIDGLEGNEYVIINSRYYENTLEDTRMELIYLPSDSTVTTIDFIRNVSTSNWNIYIFSQTLIPTVSGEGNAITGINTVDGQMIFYKDTTFQEQLVSGTSIKTINNNSLLGSGNLDVSEFYKIPLNDSTLIFYAASGYIPDLSALNTACNNLLAAVKSGKIPVMKFSDGIADVWVAALIQYPENSDPGELLPMSFTTLYNSYTTYTIKAYKDSNTSNWIILGTQRNLLPELTFDSTPTANSNNPVTSGGVKTALDDKQNKAIELLLYLNLMYALNNSDQLNPVTLTGDNLTDMNYIISKYNNNNLFTFWGLLCIIDPEQWATWGIMYFDIPYSARGSGTSFIIHRVENTDDLFWGETYTRGSDNVPASGSNGFVTSNGIYQALLDKLDILESGTNIKTINNTSVLGSGNIAVQPTLVGSGTGLNIKTVNGTSLLGSGNISPLKVGSVAGKLYRNNVGGSGNFSISGNSGCIPNLTAGTFLVAIYAKSATQSYTFTFNFGTGNTYSLSTTNGELNDLRTITISSSATFSGSVSSGSVAAGTILYVVMYNYLTPVQTVGIAAVTNRYADLDGTPTIPTVNNGTLTIQKNGTTVQTFTANQSSSVTANITTTTPMTTVAGGSVTLAMTANTLYKIGSTDTPCTSLTITLTAGASGVANYYHGIVITGANMTFNKPSTVTLGGGKSLPTFTAGGTFEFSILENIMYFEYTEA